MHAREGPRETVGLGIDDEIDVALAVERDVLRAVFGDGGKAKREGAEGEGSPPLMIGGGGANETKEKLALRSALGSTPLFVGEVRVETIVVDSHVVKVPILIESRQMTFRC